MEQTFVGDGECAHTKLLADSASSRLQAAPMIGTDAPEIVQALATAMAVILTAGVAKARFGRTMAMHSAAAEEPLLMRGPTRLRRA